jgi:hypothetical protein
MRRRRWWRRAEGPDPSRAGSTSRPPTDAIRSAARSLPAERPSLAPTASPGPATHLTGIPIRCARNAKTRAIDSSVTFGSYS